MRPIISAPTTVPTTVPIAGAESFEILNLVRTERSTTRQELERESELGTATGGRAPRLVRFSAERANILVATLDQTALGVGIADLTGRLKMEHHEEADLTGPVSALCDRLTTLFRWIIDRQEDRHDLWGISISTPGAVVDGTETRFHLSTPPVLPGWESFRSSSALWRLSMRRYG